MKRLASIAFLVVCGLQVGATDCGQILADSGFDLWCGDRLCYWKLERGDIDQVATWHDGDDGVAMIGDDVAISQMTQVNSSDTDCMRFDLVADIDETAEVHLQADVFGDGTVDFDERLPTSSWDALSLRIGISGYYEGVLFRITKVGPGGATLAQIKAEVVEDGEGGCPRYIDPIPLPLGARCDGSQPCASGICGDGVCSECETVTDCGTGEVCGREQHAGGLLDDWHVCIPAASRALGELCYLDTECATGVCNTGFCSECYDASSCGDTASCFATDGEASVYTCDLGARASGQPCSADAMCASGVCDGVPVGWCDGLGPDLGTPNVQFQCFGDQECPQWSGITSGTCTFVAVAGGTCQ